MLPSILFFGIFIGYSKKKLLDIEITKTTKTAIATSDLGGIVQKCAKFNKIEKNI